MKKIICFILTLVLFCGCAPVLKSTVTPLDEEIPQVQEVDRILLKGFPYEQHYPKGRQHTYGPSAGVRYGITKVAKTIVHNIGMALGFTFLTTDYEGYGDIGSVIIPTKDFIEDTAMARSVLTLEEKKQMSLTSKPLVFIFEGKSGNAAVQGATPWSWGTLNVIEYITLLAFLGVPVHYEKEATVSLAVYNKDYERLGKFKGYAHVSQGSYVVPDEKLVEATLIYAYRDAVNKAANNWTNILARSKE